MPRTFFWPEFDFAKVVVLFTLGAPIPRRNAYEMSRTMFSPESDFAKVLFFTKGVPKERINAYEMSRTFFYVRI